MMRRKSLFSRLKPNTISEAVLLTYDDCIEIAREFTGQGVAVRRRIEEHRDASIEIMGRRN